MDLIKKEVNSAHGGKIDIKYTVSTGGGNEKRDKERLRNQSEKTGGAKRNKELNNKFSFASFIEGTHNQFAKAAALNVSEKTGAAGLLTLSLFMGA